MIEKKAEIVLYPWSRCFQHDTQLNEKWSFNQVLSSYKNRSENATFARGMDKQFTRKIEPEPDYLGALLRADDATLAQFYQNHFPDILQFIRNHGGADEHARDIFQDALIVVLQKARQSDFEITESFGGFFFTICRNLWLNRRTKKSTVSEVTLSDEAKHTAVADLYFSDAELLKLERGKLFWRAFRKLGADCQKVLELFFQSTPMEEIARQMGYGSEGYARRSKHICKERLIEFVKSSPEFHELKLAGHE